MTKQIIITISTLGTVFALLIFNHSRLKVFLIIQLTFLFNILLVKYLYNIQSAPLIGWFQLDDLVTTILSIGLLTTIIIIILISCREIFEKKQPKINKLHIYHRIYYEEGKYYEMKLDNNELLDIHESIKAMYNTLINDDFFIKFGKHKIVFITAMFGGVERSLHSNIHITNDMTFDQYYAKVSKYICKHYEEGYKVDVINEFIIKVWNADPFVNSDILITKTTNKYHNITVKNNRQPHIQKRSYYTQNKYIDQIKNKGNQTIKSFATMDLETININGIQYPIAISCYNGLLPKLFMVDIELLKLDYNQAIINMFKQYFDFIKTIGYPKTIFVHNLGSFDGYFLYKYLLLIEDYNSVSSIIDKQHEFIQISLGKINFKDSYRIFGVSLDKLCKNFGVVGKTGKYNPEFNKITLFDNQDLLNQFIDYSLQDSTSLYNAMFNAQRIYFDNYQQDITQVHSTSSLSMKIFRRHFLKDHKIPVLTHSQDDFIRQAYYGGSTDLYKAYAKDLHYYDVNSLYPFAMMKPMPDKFICQTSIVNLNNFFGFVEAYIECPKTVSRPVLPIKSEDRTIYPYGKWLGVYFSEELKAVIKLGYIVTPIKGYKFTSKNIFDDYITHFYEQKKTSTGSQRFIAKMHLNQLYGVFGRSLDQISTINVHVKDLHMFMIKEIVDSLIKINHEIFVLLVKANCSPEWLKQFRSNVTETKNIVNGVPSNVAIASAVTAYARIHMIPFKLNPAVVYTDTDSIFTTEKLDPSLIGKELGLMKDELDGLVIKEAIFLGIKKYGYYYYDKDGIKQEKSVISGVARNTVSFDEMKQIFNGDKITKTNDVRFYKSFNDLNIAIKPSKVSITFDSYKKYDKLSNLYLTPVLLTYNHFKINFLNNIIKYLNKSINLINKYKNTP